MNAVLTVDQAEAAAGRILAWMAQVQRDRSLPLSALGTAFDLVKGLIDGVESVDVAKLRASLAERGCSLDRDVHALVRGRHLLWCMDADGTARAIMLVRHGGRRGRRA